MQKKKKTQTTHEIERLKIVKRSKRSHGYWQLISTPQTHNTIKHQNINREGPSK